MLALVLAFVAGFAVARLIASSVGGIAGVIPALLGGAGVYAGLFVVVGGVNERDRERLVALLSTLRLRWGRRRAAPAEAGSSYAS
jgi:hypothetical protein